MRVTNEELFGTVKAFALTPNPSLRSFMIAEVFVDTNVFLSAGLASRL